MAKAILIFDAKCPYCRAFKNFLSRLDREKKISFWSFYSTQAKELLSAQFGKEYGFALFLFEEGKVSIGESAVKASFRIVKKPTLFLHRLYPAITIAVSKATGRKRKIKSPIKSSTARTKARARKIVTKNI